MAALNQRLTKPLLERVELRASALRPDVQRQATGVSELEFVICMAVELGMVGAAAARVRPPMLRGVIFDMDGTLTKPNLE